jgi:S-adenosylmethionine hydrolase
VFLVVVDPGVGSSRRGVAIEAGGYRFVGPDNGVFGLVCGEHLPARAVELTESRYGRPTVSRTFEGRDRFAPAAAWLAQGVEIAALGRSAGSLHRLQVPQPVVSGGAIHGEVVRVDRFGNLITNIDRRAVEALGAGDLEIRIGGRQVPRFVSTYAEAAPGELCALFGSTDHLEVAASGASAAALLAVGRGAAVRLAQRA